MPVARVLSRRFHMAPVPMPSRPSTLAFRKRDHSRATRTATRSRVGFPIRGAFEALPIWECLCRFRDGTGEHTQECMRQKR